MNRKNNPIMVDASIQSLMVVILGLVTAFTDYQPSPQQSAALLTAAAFINVIWANFTKKKTQP